MKNKISKLHKNLSLAKFEKDKVEQAADNLNKRLKNENDNLKTNLEFKSKELDLLQKN